MVALWALTFSTVERMTNEAMARAVDVDLAGLADIHASGGTDELAQRINDRLSLIGQEGNVPHYLLAREDGSSLAGDLTTWPRLRPQMSEAGEFSLPDGTDIYGRATLLGPNLRLLVAREKADDTALLRQINIIFLIAGAAFIIAVGLFGAVASNRLSERILRVNAAFKNPVPDQLKLLEASEDGRDEIGELTALSSAALLRQARLVETHRQTSDQIAHEIRTPLMHLDTQLLKALKGAPHVENASHLIEARGEIKRLIALLESLLDIAASRARQGDPHGLKPVDLSEITSRLGDLYADSAEESGHIFTCDIAPDVSLNGEEIQLTRLITNLLDNAFKYVPKGGRVSLILKPGPVLTVSDDGPGIAVEDHTRIFDRFQRGKGQAAHSAGAGLGLALAKAIAERHNLSITLDRTKKGACFVISGEG